MLNHSPATRIPYIPPELVQQVFRERSDSRAEESHFSDLRSTSLVYRTWESAASARIWTHVVIRTDRALQKFMDCAHVSRAKRANVFQQPRNLSDSSLCALAPVIISAALTILFSYLGQPIWPGAVRATVILTISSTSSPQQGNIHLIGLCQLMQLEILRSFNSPLSSWRKSSTSCLKVEPRAGAAPHSLPLPESAAPETPHLPHASGRRFFGARGPSFRRSSNVPGQPPGAVGRFARPRVQFKYLTTVTGGFANSVQLLRGLHEFIGAKNVTAPFPIITAFLTLYPELVVLEVNIPDIYLPNLLAAEEDGAVTLALTHRFNLNLDAVRLAIGIPTPVSDFCDYSEYHKHCDVDTPEEVQLASTLHFDLDTVRAVVKILKRLCLVGWLQTDFKFYILHLRSTAGSIPASAASLMAASPRKLSRALCALPAPASRSSDSGSLLTLTSPSFPASPNPSRGSSPPACKSSGDIVANHMFVFKKIAVLLELKRGCLDLLHIDIGID
ncbi:hypothetical protein BDK51DRAFT_51383 [Blyttiomyces helicus]|uniref:Uncharacterized protein n=1 Tax=Blyttiomyces helicus TaxID=388810 RepID=A0A4P9WLA2_9FUNG|nr:hypothetical protein BDK51DRAFT_51383 [Blyttiomyces helicus]|eukprot:RKO93821.1 hypothetical protein BDK51DRAFT_51383 [Blyttiomyces helicus]